VEEGMKGEGDSSVMLKAHPEGEAAKEFFPETPLPPQQGSKHIPWLASGFFFKVCTFCIPW